MTSTHSSSLVGGIGRKRTWEESFVALKAYKAIHGDCLVPIHTHYEDPALGGWVHHQRSKKDKLTEDQRSKLESIGFVWRLRVRNKQWGEMLARLKKHHKNPDAKDDDELSKFVQDQRLKYTRGQLSNARQKQLEAVGVVFGNGSAGNGGSGAAHHESDSDDSHHDNDDDDNDGDSTISYNDHFKQHYQQLVDFHIRHGHCRIPRGDTANNHDMEEEEQVDKNALRSWVASLRRKYILNPRTGLDPKCLELLDDLNFEWYEAIAQEDPREDDDSEEEDEEGSGSESSESEEEEEGASVKVEALDADNEEDENDSKLSDEESSSSSSSEGSDSDSDNSDDDGDDKEESQKQQQTQVKKHKRQLLTKKRKLPSSSLSSSLMVLDKDHDSGDDNDNSSGSSSISSSCSSNARRAKRIQRQNSRDIRFMKHYNDLLEFKRTFGHVRYVDNCCI